MLFRVSLICVLAVGVLTPSAVAQDVYELRKRTIYEDRPVTKTRIVYETVIEKQEVTEYVDEVVVETRDRRTKALRPFIETKMREDRYEVQKPIVETSMEQETVAETVYEDVIEMQEQLVLVEKPVTETYYRDETVTVQKPVSETYYKTENITTLKPQLQSQTVCKPTTTTTAPGLFANRLQVLPRGYYTDPTTGQQVYRRGGLHWVENTPTTQTTLVPEQQLTTVLIPEVTQQLKPVTVSGYQNVQETRRVPVEVQSTQKVYETRKVPVTVQKPTVKYVTRSVPKTTTRYATEERVVQTPITETTYKVVEVVEPIKVEVVKKVPVTRVIEVPKKIGREESYETTEKVGRVVVERIPLDENGKPLRVLPPILKSLPTETTLTEKTETAKASLGPIEGTFLSPKQTELTGEKATLIESRIIEPSEAQLDSRQVPNGSTNPNGPMVELATKEADKSPEIKAPTTPDDRK